MKIQQFNGGQSSRLRPQYIGQNEAVSYVNIDNAAGSLAPVKDKLDAGFTLEQYHKFFHAEQVWVDSATEAEFLEYQQTMYIVDGAQPKKYRDGKYNNLGVVAPDVAPSLANPYSVEPVTDFTIYNQVSEIGSYGDLPMSDLRYRIINVSADIGFGANFSKVVEVVVEKNTVTGAVVVTSQILTAEQAAAPVGDVVIEDPNSPYDRTLTFSNFKGELGQEVQVYRYYEGVWRFVTELWTVGPQPGTPGVDDVEDVSANVELDLSRIGPFEGTYQYVYTYYNAEDGTESAPSPLSDELEASGGQIVVTDLAVSLDPQVTHKRLYRVGGSIAQFTLVVQLDATETAYTDTLSDTEVDGTLLESDNHSEAPAELRYLSESYAMLFGAVGDSLRFTPIGKPNAWPPEYSIAFDADITGIGAVANGIIVCTAFKTYLVTGTGPFSLAQQSLSGDQGCVSHASMQEVGSALIWASAEGLCVSSGGTVQNITKDKLGRLDLDPVDSELDDEVYYCHNSDGSTLAWDFRFGNIPKYLDLGISAISVANSELYGWQDGHMYKLFQSPVDLSFTYVSPRFIEGSATESKTYKKVHIYSKGDIIINILINDALVSTKSLTGEGDFQLQVPNGKQRGNFIQFEITGTGEVYEYEYVAGRTQNG